MGKDQERDKDDQATAKPDQRDKKPTDLTADKKDKDVIGGGGPTTTIKPTGGPEPE